jgi:hypothetical protein
MKSITVIRTLTLLALMTSVVPASIGQDSRGRSALTAVVQAVPPSSFVTWSIPNGSVPTGLTTSVGASSTTFNVTLAGVNTNSGGTIFKVILSGSKVIVGCTGSASVSSLGISSGQAKLVDYSTMTILGSATFNVSGTGVTMGVGNTLLNGAIALSVESSYAPAWAF